MSEAEKSVLKEMATKYNVDFDDVKNIHNWRDIDTRLMAKVLPHF